MKINAGYQEKRVLSVLLEATDILEADMICGGELHLFRKEGWWLQTPFEYFHLSVLRKSQIQHVQSRINHLPTKLYFIQIASFLL